MLSGRSVIIAVVLLAIVSTLVAIASLLGPPDSGGLGSDTYGTRAHGYRAIFDTLAELGMVVDRTTIPPSESLDRPVTVVLWCPNSDLVDAEPSYLRRVGAWVREGGSVVLAAEAPRDLSAARERRTMRSALKETSTIAELGLPEITTRVVDLTSGKNVRTAKDAGRVPGRNRQPWNLRERVSEGFNPELPPTRRVTVAADGELATIVPEAMSLELPEQVQTLVIEGIEPVGRITIDLGQDEPLVMAAHFRLGQGAVTVVGDPQLAENRMIAKADNAVLAVRLLVGDDLDRIVLWDEFYHGLTIRGQPLFLLTRGTYATLAILCVAATAAWVWRSAIFLGPPLAPQPIMRRTLAEYVEAMARFLNRGGHSRHFVIREVRSGLLWSVRRNLGLPLGKESPHDLAAVLARRDPAAAKRLLDAVAAADLTLSSRSRLAEHHTLAVLKGLNDCL